MMPIDAASSWTGWGGRTQPFVHAVSVMYFSTDPMVTASYPFSMTQFPALYGDTPYVRADSHSLVLPTQAATDPEVRAAAYDMAASMLKNSLLWAEGGHVPALSAVAESPEYLALEPQSRRIGQSCVAQRRGERDSVAIGCVLLHLRGQCADQ